MFNYYNGIKNPTRGLLIDQDIPPPMIHHPPLMLFVLWIQVLFFIFQIVL